MNKATWSFDAIVPKKESRSQRRYHVLFAGHLIFKSKERQQALAVCNVCNLWLSRLLLTIYSKMVEIENFMIGRFR